jgi:ribonucleoside-diphosphate reductase alpha chain
LWKSTTNPTFRSKLSEDIFNQKYRHSGADTWDELSATLVNDVCGDLGDGSPFMKRNDRDTLTKFIREMKFIPGGRYLYYAGRANKYFNNCYLLRAEEDSRQDWANLSWKSESCLTTGGGIGADYSIYRGRGKLIHRTGGSASGPVSKMEMINEIGRRVMQGGTRRSAIYASLNHAHDDIDIFLKVKDWHSIKVPGTDKTLADLKKLDFNWPAPLDMTNISVNYDTEWLLKFYKDGDCGTVFLKNVEQALRTGEPGFSFNFFDKENETLRNACTEVTSCDDSDVCNLGSINLSRVDTVSELAAVCDLSTQFLLYGTLRATLPYEKVYEVRNKNRRLGLGLMGVHEWLVKRGYKYEVSDELHQWLSVYRGVSDHVSRETANRIGISSPVANRAIAPTGTIGLIAGTTTGIEPVYAVAYKRRYLTDGIRWKYQYAVDHAAQEMIELYGVDPDTIESATDLASDYERRIKFQADIQDYVDMSISSTINLPTWGSDANNPGIVSAFAETLAKYSPRLRGFTVYPDGSRGGQPLTKVSYDDVKHKLGTVFEEHIENNDVCDITGRGGSCGT